MDFRRVFGPSTSIKEEPSKSPYDDNDQIDRAIYKPSVYSRRSASLFTDPSTAGLSRDDRPYSGGNGVSRRLIRRFSSPLLSTRCADRPLDNEISFCDGRRLDSDRCDGTAIFRRPDRFRERDMVSRSFSLRLNDDGDLYESFSPADLDVKELLGKGFYGEVFKVIYRKTGRPMVLKRLYRMDAKCEQDFVKEAAVMRQLHHPNVLRFLGVLYNDKKLHLVTEYVGGGTLRKLLDSQAELTWSKRMSIAKDVASGMAYLHSKNIIHRDLNSGNILIREENFAAVVADFGLARVLGRRRTGRRRRLTVVGDPYLMAPEMSKEEPYNDRVDVFSYGITLCEIIGRCSSDPDVMPRRQDFGIDQQRYTSQFVDDFCPRPFLGLAFKCAAVNPDERPPFASIERWLLDLLDDSNQESAYEKVSRELAEFKIREERITTASEGTASSVETGQTGDQHSPQKRRRSADMGYASGRSREDSPRDGNVEMAGLE